jgi:hypothetical protein
VPFATPTIGLSQGLPPVFPTLPRVEVEGIILGRDKHNVREVVLLAEPLKPF